MSHFPLDLATQLFILPNFPVKSPLRFRCLSKSFCSHIDSPDFIKKRLKTSMDTKTNLKLILPTVAEMIVPSSWTLQISTTDSNKPSNSTTQSQHQIGTPSFVVLVMVLFFWAQKIQICEDCVVWNPTTRQSRKLPVCPVTTLPGHKFFCGGLGYDSTTDDYKVVMMAAVPVADKRVVKFGFLI